MRRFQRRKRNLYLIAHPEWKVELSVHALPDKAPGARLLEEDADRSVEIRIGRPLADIEIVETLPGVVQRTDLVQPLGVE